MASISTTKAVEDLQQHAERIANNDTQRLSDGAGVGDTFVQGDVYFTVLDSLPQGCVPTHLPVNRQLAIGQTQGARHCLDSLDGVTAYRLPDPGMLDGPVLVLDLERTVEHPEHGHVVLPANRIYAVSYQRNLDAEEREMLARD